MSRTLKTCFVLFAVVVSLFLAGQQVQAEPIVLNMSMDPQKIPTAKIMVDFYTEVFTRAGLELTVVYTPLDQCLPDANEGKVGGTMMRIAEVLEGGQYPNLMLVPQMAGKTPYSAFAKDPNLKITGWADLKNLKVAAWKGSIIVERGLKANVPDENVTYAASVPEALMLLAQGKVDVAAVTAVGAFTVLGMPEFKDSGIKPVCVLAAPDLFIIVNKKYAAHADTLAKSIKEALEDGTFKRITGMEPPK